MKIRVIGKFKFVFFSFEYKHMQEVSAACIPDMSVQTFLFVDYVSVCVSWEINVRTYWTFPGKISFEFISRMQTLRDGAQRMFIASGYREPFYFTVSRFLSWLDTDSI